MVLLALACQLIKSFPYGWMDDEIEIDTVSLCILLIKLIEAQIRVDLLSY